MRAHQTFDCRLQIEVQRCSHRPAQSRISRHECVDKVRRAPRRIDSDNLRRLREQCLLIVSDNAKLSEPDERARVFTICFLRVPPRIQPRRRLRQTGEENCFAQSEIARRFIEICPGCGFRADPAVAIAAAIQIFGEDALLAPASL